MCSTPEKKDIFIFPEQLIIDEKARKKWVELFGSQCYFVTFSEFSKKFITPLKKIAPDYKQTGNWPIKLLFFNINLDLETTVCHFVHFPKNDTITPFAFNCLFCHWGPYDKLLDNLLNIAMRPGIKHLLNLLSFFFLILIKF